MEAELERLDDERERATSRRALASLARTYLRLYLAADEPGHRAVAHRRLALLLTQERFCTRRVVRKILCHAGYSHHLSLRLLRLPRRLAQPLATASAASHHGGALAYENVLPPSLLRVLRRALRPGSSFWAAHNYVCGRTPFFSYVHPLGGEPRNALDRAIAVVHARATESFPELRRATKAEWWAHCRPHTTGHQFHFDSADEGRGRHGPRHPMASSALFLSSGAGGPTVVLDQVSGARSLASSGRAVLPRTNRLLVFDGRLLHGVLPGCGVAPSKECGTATERVERIERLSLMVAFWDHMREHPGGGAGAARPFPYDGAGGWPALFEADKDVLTEEAGDGPPMQLRKVEPVWKRVAGGEAPLPARMPEYERCFTGV